FAMATRNGARALGREGEIGVLHAGALADMIGIPFTGRRSSIYEGLIGHEGPVALSLIDGEWAVPPRGCKAPHLTHL
ncbi:MAG TPA: hypothetical protein VHH88_06750, partial [Verrucomicrobiae bacterium]|nr:hypothetical protein [Verrucomicrobiae bacterium]